MFAIASYEFSTCSRIDHGVTAEDEDLHCFCACPQLMTLVSHDHFEFIPADPVGIW
jgi:hypothetical protein